MPFSRTIDAGTADRAGRGRDPRSDGRPYVGVLSTGICCRPSCPARTPEPQNCRSRPTAAGCVAAGFRVWAPALVALAERLDAGLLRTALGGLGPTAAPRRGEGWRPWRGYAAQHLWTAAALPAQHRPEDR